MGYLRGWQPRDMGKICNIAHFAIGKAHRGRNHELQKGAGAGCAQYGKCEV